MSAKFSLDDYVDVAERIQQFKQTHPDGSLQGAGEFITEPVVGYLYVARAYRTPDDPRPAVGTAFEPIPGKTPYTRDSEVQNAETAAWGRAIVALGFGTKKIASRQEVQARQPAPAPEQPKALPPNPGPADEGTALDDAIAEISGMVRDLAKLRGVKVPEAQATLEATFGKPLSELSPLEASMARGRLAGWLAKAKAA